MAEMVRKRSPFLVAAVAWLVPGAGYLLIGQRARGLTVGVTIFALIILGILIGGVRVYDVPGVDRYGYVLKLGYHEGDRGRMSRLRDTDEHPSPSYRGNEREKQKLTPAITGDFMTEVFDKPWYALQALSGVPAVVLSKISISVAHPDPADPAGVESVRRSHAAVWEMGVLYTAIAGMLNLLAMIDSAYRAARGPAVVDPQPTALQSLPVPPPPRSPVQRPIQGGTAA